MAIAWVAAQGADIIPLVGSRKRDQLTESLGALELKLNPDDLKAIEQAIPKNVAAGTRYDARQMAHLDSEA
jgi:aryl-alcohol dehydrogenase-like predicted oxidoreductase